MRIFFGASREPQKLHVFWLCEKKNQFCLKNAIFIPSQISLDDFVLELDSWKTFPIIAPPPRSTPLGAARRALTSCQARKRFSPIWNKFGNCFFHQQIFAQFLIANPGLIVFYPVRNFNPHFWDFFYKRRKRFRRRNGSLLKKGFVIWKFFFDWKNRGVFENLK